MDNFEKLFRESRNIDSPTSTKPINEVSRRDLIKKTQSQSPKRYSKSKGYKKTFYNYRCANLKDLLSKDILVLKADTKGDKDVYTCTVKFEGFLGALKEVFSKGNKKTIDSKVVRDALFKALDATDIFVDCSCSDFNFRHRYWATKFGYNAGKRQTKPPKIRNPLDSEGSICKHLTALLSNKKELEPFSSIINKYIKEHYKEFLRALNLEDHDYSHINYKRARNSQNTRRKVGRYSSEVPDDEEELILDTSGIDDDINKEF